MGDFLDIDIDDGGEVVAEWVVRLWRSLLWSGDGDLIEAVLGEGRSQGERGSALASILAAGRTVAASMEREKNRRRSIMAAAQIAAQAADTSPELLVSALQRAQEHASIGNDVIRAISGPPGWLGKLVHWGHLFQTQYYQWLYAHNQISFDQRYASDQQKKSGPDWWERQFTYMRGPMWGYVYAEPGHRAIRPEMQYDTSQRVDPPWSQRRQNLLSPETAVYEWIKWTTGHRTRRQNWLYMSTWGDRETRENKVGEISASLYSWPAVESLFSSSRLYRRDHRWEGLRTHGEFERFVNWFRCSRWLVWAAETWRANDPRGDAIDSGVLHRWMAHTHKWGVGYVFPERLEQRKLYGGNLETDKGDKARARMNANATVQFNTERMLELVIGTTPPVHEVDDFREVFGLLGDWSEAQTGSFRPIPRDPRPWDYALDKKIRFSEHGGPEKAMRAVARTCTGIMSSYIGGAASVALEGLMESAEGAVQSLVSEVLNSELWGTITTPLGRIAQVWESELQDALGDVWGMYDSLRTIIDDKRWDDAKAVSQTLEDYLSRARDRFAWAGDLYGDVISLPEDSRRVIAKIQG